MAPWTCAACTFENEGGTRCEICGTANPAASVKCQKCEELNRGRDNAWDVTLCRECRGKTVEEEDPVPEPTPMISKYGLCMLCYSRVRLRRAVTIPECNDTFCRPCFKKWVEARVVPIPFSNVAMHGDVFRLTCPLESCETQLSWRDAESAVGIQAMRRFGEWQAEALTHIYTAVPYAPSEAEMTQYMGDPSVLGPRCERTFCSNAACRLRTGTQTCIPEADLHLWSMQEIAKALNVNGISCPDNRQEGAERLASFLGTTLKPPPQTPSSNHTDPSPLSAALKDKVVASPSHPPVAPGLPSMTSAEQHVWHFCTSCAARVCNACGYRDERGRHSEGASGSSSASQSMTCSQWQSWAAFHAIKRLEFEWDKYPETYANWPRSKMDKTEAGVGNVEKMVSKQEAERAAGAVWAKGTGYGGDEDRAAFYGHAARHHCTALKAGELLERSTGDAAIEPAVETLVQALDLSSTRDRFGGPLETGKSPDDTFTEPAPIPLGACSLLRQSRPFRRLLQLGLQSHPLGLWNTGTPNATDFGKGRAKLARLYLALLRQLAGEVGLRGLLFSDLFTTKSSGSTSAGSRLIAALVDLNTEVTKPKKGTVGKALKHAFFGKTANGAGPSSGGQSDGATSAAAEEDDDLADVIKGTYAYLWGSEEWTDSEAAWKRRKSADDSSDDSEDEMEGGGGADAAFNARKDAEREAYKAALKPLLFTEAPISAGHYFARSGASSSSGGAHLHQHQKHIMKEMANLAESLPLEWDSSVHIRVDSSQTHVLKALILAPNDTPYANGAFVFDILLPHNYPAVAPKVQLLTTGGGSVRFNPNLYECGKVCLSLLGTWSGPGWKAFESTLLQVLVSIQSFIFVSEPYYNEPGHELHLQAAMSQAYNANIRRHCLQQAILNQLRKPPPAFADVISEHFSRKRREIEEQCATWVMESDTLAGGDIARVAAELKEEFKTRFGPLPEPGRPAEGAGPGREAPEERAVKRQNFGKS